MPGIPARSGARARLVRTGLALPLLALCALALCTLVPALRASAEPAAEPDVDDDGAAPRRLPTARVTAIRPEELPEDPSSFSTVIDAADHEGEAATVATLLGESVGVQLRSFGGPGQPSEISIRGSTGQQVVVMLDGVRLNTAQSGTVDLSTIPLAIVDRIEVSRGAGGTQAGSGALGGAVNIVTKAPTGASRTTAGFSGGSFGTWQGSLSHAGRAGPVDYGGSYAGFTTDGDWKFQSLEIQAGGQPPVESRELRRINDESESHSLMLQGGSDLAPGLRLSGMNHLYYLSRGQPGPDTNPEAPNGGQSSTAHDRSARDVASLRLDADGWERLPDALSLESTVSYLYEQSRYREPMPSFGLPIETRQKNRSGAWKSAARAEGRALSLEHEASLGFELRYDTLSSSDAGYHRRTTTALVVGDELGPSDFLRGVVALLPSVRFEHTDDFGSEWIPHLGLILTPLPWLRFKGNVERTYRAPDFDELYFPDKGFIRGNPNLDPERALAGDVGVELGFEKVWLLEKLRVQAAWFDQDIDNSIVFQRINATTIAPTNTNDARVQGIELAASFALLRWIELSGNWTHQDAELDRPQLPSVPGLFPPIGQQPGTALPGRADDEVSLRASVGPESRLFTLVAERHYTSKIHLSFSDEPTLSSRVTWDLSLSVDLVKWWRPDTRWFPNELLASVAVLNLTDESVRDSVGFPLPGRTLTLGLQAAW